MSSELDLGDPTAVALAAYRALLSAGIEAALYGGLALAAYGEPRETQDADFAVVGIPGSEAVAALRRAAPESTLSFDRRPFGGNLVSRVALVEGGGATGLNTVDLVQPRSSRFARAALDRAITASLRQVSIRVLAPEDFVLLKILSTRDRDLEDAASVLGALGPQLDRALIGAEVRALAIEILDHDVAGRFARLPAPG